MLFFWILRPGVPWRNLPPEYGRWKTVHQRFIRCRDRQIWEKLFEMLIDEPDFGRLMMDANHCKVPAHTAGTRGGNQGKGKTKTGLNSKIHLAVDAHGMPVRVIVTAGATADCTQAVALIDGIAAQFLLADRGYATDQAINETAMSGCEAAIPPKKNRKMQRSYDKHIYRKRHLVENAFLHLKRWRGIATRQAKMS